MERSVYHSAGTREEELFTIKSRSYKQQYANLYWLRLVALRKLLLRTARRKWASLAPAPLYVARVLDVTPRTLSYIVGTVYMDMSMKPNILTDLAREHYIAPPPPRRKFCNPSDEIMLEDESGRVRLIGDLVQSGMGKFVTGTIMAVLGAENKAGDFEVLDICFPGLAPQPALPPLPPHPSSKVTTTTASTSKDAQSKDVEMNSEGKNEGEWIALLSGLEMGGGSDEVDLRIQLMAEWLVGELGDEDDVRESMKITRVILVGNSLMQPEVKEDAIKKPKIYGYDATLHSSLPTTSLDAFLAQLLPTLSVELLPGESDPTGPTMPQQALHEALLPLAHTYAAQKDSVLLEAEAREVREREEKAKGKKSEIVRAVKERKEVEIVGVVEKGREGEGWARRTNPFWGRCGDSSILATSGQTLDDIFKYLASEDRLGMAKMTLEWSHIAPTCPDTLWCYPFATHDPFILNELPHIYIIGNQPNFATKLITSSTFSPELPQNPSNLFSNTTTTTNTSNSKLRKGKGKGTGEESDEEMIIMDSKPKSKSKVIGKKGEEEEEEEEEEEGGEKKCRIILLEKFSRGGSLVLVNSKSLEVRCIQFGI